jgi:thioredoxin-dependent peroxiredoxin
MTQEYRQELVPQENFKTRQRVDDQFEWVNLTTDDLFKGKRVVAFSLPGAFTPTCSNMQVPGYQALHEDFTNLGIDKIYCISCNDAFVMNAWAEDQRAPNIEFIPDGSCNFTKNMGMLVAKDNLGFGMRSWRYAMIVNDGVIEQMFVEPGMCDDYEEDPYGETSPENLLEYLRHTL